MRAIDVVFAIGWALFWIGWLAAATRAKSGRASWRRYGVARLIAVVLVVILRRAHFFDHPASPGPTSVAVGLTLFVLGLSVAIWARRHLGRNWGTPMSQKENPELVTSGPYRWIRNPIYSGLILALVGTAVAIDLQWLAIVVLISGYFIYSAVMEQRYMTATFPATYPAYRDSTKMLVPYVF